MDQKNNSQSGSGPKSQPPVVPKPPAAPLPPSQKDPAPAPSAPPQKAEKKQPVLDESTAWLYDAPSKKAEEPRKQGVGIPVTSDESMPPRQDAVKPAPQPEAGAQEKQQEQKDPGLIIRTMRDDMLEAKQNKQTANTQPVQKEGKGQQSQPAPGFIKSQQDSEKGKIRQPDKKERPGFSYMRAIAVSAIVILFAVAAAGGAWWFFERDGRGPFQDPAVDPVEALQVIPRNAFVVLGYTMLDQRLSDQLERAWQARSGGQPTLDGLFSGDPRILLQDTEISEFYFILLPHESRPYILLPKTSFVDNLLSQQRSIQVADRDGWYIAHSLDIDPYIEQLSTGSLSQESSIDKADMKPGIHFLASRPFLSQIHTAMGGERMLGANKNYMSLYIEIDNQNNIASFEPPVTRAVRGDTTSQRELQTYVPKEASFVHIGNNFIEDLTDMQNEFLNLDAAVLAQPAVQEFLSQLTSPYVFYENKAGGSGSGDIGLIIEIPDSLRGELQLGDATIEAALAALVPKVTGRSRSGAAIAFTETEYQEVPLRYVNFIGPERAIDYAITGNYLLVATSKDGMLSLIDVVTDNATGLSQDALWQPLVQADAFGESTIMASVMHPALSRLLPLSNIEDIPFIVTRHSVQGIPEIKGVFLLAAQGPVQER